MSAGPRVTGAQAARLGRQPTGEPQRPCHPGKRTGSSKPVGDQTEKDEPQPQVVDAFGFLMTNCAPSRSSL